MITTLEECREAISILFGSGTVSVEWYVTLAEVPGGCSYRIINQQGDIQLLFNTGLTTSSCCKAREDIFPICLSGSLNFNFNVFLVLLRIGYETL